MANDPAPEPMLDTPTTPESSHPARLVAWLRKNGALRTFLARTWPRRTLLFTAGILVGCLVAYPFLRSADDDSSTRRATTQEVTQQQADPKPEPDPIPEAMAVDDAGTLFILRAGNTVDVAEIVDADRTLLRPNGSAPEVFPPIGDAELSLALHMAGLPARDLPDEMKQQACGFDDTWTGGVLPSSDCVYVQGRPEDSTLVMVNRAGLRHELRKVRERVQMTVAPAISGVREIVSYTEREGGKVRAALDGQDVIHVIQPGGVHRTLKVPARLVDVHHMALGPNNQLAVSGVGGEILWIDVVTRRFLRLPDQVGYGDPAQLSFVDSKILLVRYEDRNSIEAINLAAEGSNTWDILDANRTTRSNS